MAAPASKHYKHIINNQMWVRHSPATRTAFLPRRRLVARTAMWRMGRGSELHVVGTVSVSARGWLREAGVLRTVARARGGGEVHLGHHLKKAAPPGAHLGLHHSCWVPQVGTSPVQQTQSYVVCPWRPGAWRRYRRVTRVT
eukprot:1313925-Prymnesium_polylepis.1